VKPWLSLQRPLNFARRRRTSTPWRPTGTLVASPNFVTRCDQRTFCRRIKELQFVADENRKNSEKAQEMVDKLQAKIRAWVFVPLVLGKFCEAEDCLPLIGRISFWVNGAFSPFPSREKCYCYEAPSKLRRRAGLPLLCSKVCLRFSSKLSAQAQCTKTFCQN